MFLQQVHPRKGEGALFEAPLLCGAEYSSSNPAPFKNTLFLCHEDRNDPGKHPVNSRKGAGLTKTKDSFIY